MLSYYSSAFPESGAIFDIQDRYFDVCFYFKGQTDGAQISPLLEGQKISLTPKFRFDLEQVEQKRDFNDCSLWIVSLTNQMYLDGPYGVWPYTFHSKSSGKDWGGLFGISQPLTIFVPWKGCSIQDCSVSTKVHPEFQIISNQAFQSMDFQSSLDVVRPHLNLLGPSEVRVDEKVSFEIIASTSHGGIFPRDLTYTVEVNAGYLPKNAVRVKEGSGSFSLVSLGLEPGDEITIKVGFQFYSNLARHTVKVV